MRATPYRRRSSSIRAASRQKTLWQALLGAREEEAEPVVSEPILRRLSDDELTLVEAADLFNQSDFRRTVAGVAKSLGEPKVSIVPLTGVNAETVLTFAWDITWYQYRVTPDAAQPVRIADRGHDIGEVESAYAHWNARFDDTGRLVPTSSPLAGVWLRGADPCDHRRRGWEATRRWTAAGPVPIHWPRWPR